MHTLSDTLTQTQDSMTLLIYFRLKRKQVMDAKKEVRRAHSSQSKIELNEKVIVHREKEKKTMDMFREMASKFH